MTTATEAVRVRAEASTGPDPIEHWEVIVIGADGLVSLLPRPSTCIRDAVEVHLRARFTPPGWHISPRFTRL